MSQPPSKLIVGGVEVDFGSGEIVRAGRRVRVTPKAARTLAVLCERPGQAVAKEELIERVWAGAYVTDHVVWHCIAELRRAFDDDARDPRVIETLPRRGYRMVAEVAPVAEVAAAPVAEVAAAPVAEAVATRVAEAVVTRIAEAIAVPVARSGGAANPGRRTPDRVAAGVIFVTGILLAAAGWWLRGPGSSPAPDDPDALVAGAEEAYARYTGGNNERALELFERAVDLDPADARAQAGLANAYAQKSMFHSSEPWWSERAEQAARRAVALDPERAESHKALGLALASQSRLGEAAEAYRRALEIDPGLIGALNNLGLTETMRGNLAAAAVLLRQADRLQPRDPQIATNLGTTYRLLGLHREATAVLEALDGWNNGRPSAAGAWQLALIDIERGALDAARLRLEAAAAYAKRDPALWLHAGDLELIAGRPDRALDRYRHALPAPIGWEPRAALGWLRAGGDVGRPPERLMREFVAMEPRQRRREPAEPALALAAVRLSLGEPAEALGWVEAAIERGYRDAAWLAVDPLFDRLHGDRRFQDLLARIEALVAGERAELAQTPATANGIGPAY